jgi:putative ABC transport system permease protein
VTAIRAACRGVIRLVALLLPPSERAEWRREWLGEIEGEWIERAERGRFGPFQQLALLWRCAGSVADVASYWLAGSGHTLRDVRFAFRGWVRAPAVTLVAILSLALGIGANTAIFSVIYNVILRPLEYPDADRLVMLWEAPRDNPGQAIVISPPDFVDWQEQSTAFESMALFNIAGGVLDDETDPIRLRGVVVSGNFFHVLGAEAALGRTFVPDEDGPDAPRIVVLSDGLWKRRFGADSSIVGRDISLSGNRLQVVGIMPPEFRGPERYFFGDSDVWNLISFDPRQSGRGGHWMRAVARLGDGVSLDFARTEMATIAQRLSEEYPETNANWTTLVRPLHEQVVGDYRPALLLMLATVGIVLLIACANVANLQLSRALARRREFAVRTALGADRGRLVRQVLGESVLLTLAGGAVGVGLAQAALHALLSVAPDVPRSANVTLNVPVLLFALGISVATGVVFGLIPAAASSVTDLQTALKDAGHGGSQGRRRSRIRGLLVVAEVALSLLLLIGAGLLTKSFTQLRSVDPGIHPEHVLSARLTLPRGMGETDRIAFLGSAMPRIAALPGVRSAGTVTSLPFHGLNNFSLGVWIEGRTETDDRPYSFYRAVTPGYLQAMGMTLVRGRWLDETDRSDGEAVLMVNDAFARRYFGDGDPLGRTVRFEYQRQFAGRIVGVVQGVRYQGLDSGIEPEMYLPYVQHAFQNPLFLAVNTAGPPARMAPSVREIIKLEAPTVVVDEIAPLTQLVAASVAGPRFSMLLVGLFAVIALILAVVGLYGVMAYSVTQRGREVGIRMALGARALQVIALVVVDGLKLVLPGMVVGLVGAYALMRVLSAMLFGVTPTDATTFVTVPAIVLVVTLIASYIPARRASRVDPTQSLRTE